MSVNFEAFVFGVLYGKCAAADVSISRVALLVDSRGAARMLTRGTGAPPSSTRTAIVNAIQQTGETAHIALKRATIYTTDTPTEMDLGMARRNGIDRIVSTGSGAMKVYTTSLASHDGTGRDLGLTAGRDTNYDAPLIRGRNINVNGWIAPGQFSTYKTALSAFWNYSLRQRRPLAQDLSAMAFKGHLAPLTFTVPIEGKNLGVSALGMSTSDRHILFLSVVHDMVHRIWGQRSDDDANRPDASYAGWNIGSILVDATGDNILAWGVNTNKRNGTRHGETNLIQYYESHLGTLPLPIGATFYTTLEPCQMCAGMLASVGRRDQLSVVWGQDDTAIAASALQRGCLGTSLCGSASRHGAHGWSDALTFRHQQTTQRFKDEATRQKQQAEIALRGRLSRDQVQVQRNRLKEADETLQGISRFASIQTTEFLRQQEARDQFGQARQRRNLSTVMSELKDVRSVVEGFEGRLTPSSVKGMRDVSSLVGGLGERDFTPHMLLSKKLNTFVEKIGTAMSRT